MLGLREIVTTRLLDYVPYRIQNHAGLSFAAIYSQARVRLPFLLSNPLIRSFHTPSDLRIEAWRELW